MPEPPSQTATLTLHSPAKVNLSLSVLRRRPDGYHDLCSLMCPVALYDTLVLTFDKKPGIRIFCDHPEVPETADNLAARAAALFFDTVFSENRPEHGRLCIRMDKQIPVGAGLGGGSSNAAAILTGLNRYYGYPLSIPSLMDLGKQIGADVSFFILGQPAWVTGIGDRVNPVPGLPRKTLVIVWPGVAVSTAWVYKNLKIRLTKDEKKLNEFDLNKPIFRLDTHLFNDLESVTEAAFPVIGTIKRLLLENSAAGALMSGSGSAVFGIFSDSDTAWSAHWKLRHHPENQNWILYVADLLV
ncbi:4-(cytidine 5'-diphospho)-2-C-methyl-D-erythritol kinase [Desulfosarcina sp. OttesenSCG-928-A07]|nr:4-(cytidine 5'-diphospho)-2-C-methyl-D-erythritol kinase [Desulfosarcina sp. OttesenSCG-928-A07]